MKIIKFGVIGSCGFLTEAIIVYVIQALFPEILSWARCFSFPPAVLATWLLNRVWTFKSSGPKTKELSKYTCLQTIGAGFNFILYYIMIHEYSLFYDYPVAALAIASLIVMFFNYFFGLLFVFKPNK